MNQNKCTHHKYLRAGLLASTLWLVVASTSLNAEDVTALNLRDVSIANAVEIVAKATHKNFLIDPTAQTDNKKITLVTGGTMSGDQLYEAFLSILQVHGLEAVESGNLIKIVPSGKARSQVAPLVANARESDVDETVTEIVKLSYIPVATAMQTLQPLVGAGETRVLPNQSSNAVVITGRAQNVARLRDVLESTDKPNNDDFELVALDYAVASQVAATLQGLMTTGAAGDGALPTGGKVSADERTNSVLISGDKQTRERMKNAIAKLDVQRATEGDTKVIPLRYAKAEDVVAVLNGVSPAIQQQTGDAPTTPGGAAPTPIPAAAMSASKGGVTVLADKSSNSIIISGPPTLQKSMMKVIAQLDRRRAQVLVEAIIAEVSTDLSNKLGAALVSNGATDGSGPVGISNFGALSTVAGLYGSVQAGAVPNVPNGLLLGGGNRSFGAIVEALKGDAATNILSTPTLVTMDNEEAEITVGQEVPFITGKSTSSSSDTTNPFTTIERKDVGLKFKITPQINRGETVNLKIDQETSNVASSSAGASDLITNKRRITTNVMVEDGQILVLGGLIEDNYRDSASKVPVLGDIPVIGSIFSSNSTSKTKQNLMVFIHPMIMPDAQSADAYTRQKYHTMQQQQQRSNVANRGILREGSGVLPADMSRVERGSADDLHNPPPPPPRKVQAVGNGKCNSIDPFCNSSL
ncbi:MAG: type II secretion system secretin GspD [Thiothrix sp.]|uniref:type II secretion system secretin GspD n=1 Tax=Thiothrix sp. TaxID=1032 RepID=UPI00261905D2|nr:type II secretion system secretin GspD [Thiothrix sp.]MDD5392654.1 type II secretion system secretin GspD [Thiothrix sp.]